MKPLTRERLAKLADTQALCKYTMILFDDLPPRCREAVRTSYDPNRQTLRCLNRVCDHLETPCYG
jgi:hypothetical protein